MLTKVLRFSKSFTKGVRCFSSSQNNQGPNRSNDTEPQPKFDNSTHFGYQDVNRGEKQTKVNEVFHSVASKYDLMNDLMSLGIHRVWKDDFVNDIGYLTSRKIYQGDKIIEEPTVVLDVAGGTGDIAFKILDKHRRRTPIPSKKELIVKVLDINSSMLEVGRQRAKAQGYDDVEFIEGNAEALDIPDESIDLYTIAFGIRNVPRIHVALKEAHRVLRKGGRFMCMEFSKVQNPIFAQIYNFYNFNVIPLVGQIVTNDRASYQYLAESIDRFPSQEVFLRMLEDAGFKSCSYTNYTDGIVAVHSGFKL